MRKKISLWLFLCALSVFIMALVGAITRLTESGLSIVEWKPVTGALPPLSEAAWLTEFDLYKQSPQYLKINAGMTLDEFKNIFFWEWFHRLWGRLIGVFYALPLLFFWRHIPRVDRPKFLGVLALGFLQGAMGWYMVKSGLVDQPAVSHYRLAAHLMLAFLIYGCLMRLGFMYGTPAHENSKAAPLRGLIRGCIALAALTMIWGAFTAGLDAGMVYNTFPKMDDYWFPPEAAQHNPMWLAFFEEPASVQFTHRILAIATFIKVMVLVFKGLRLKLQGRARKVLIFTGIAVCTQAGLGIVTLLTQVHIHVAVTHQGGAMVLLGLLVWLLHESAQDKKA